MNLCRCVVGSTVLSGLLSDGSWLKCGSCGVTSWQPSQPTVRPLLLGSILLQFVCEHDHVRQC
jgi:hypothetical protein